MPYSAGERPIWSAAGAEVTKEARRPAGGVGSGALALPVRLRRASFAGTVTTREEPPAEAAEQRERGREIATKTSGAATAAVMPAVMGTCTSRDRTRVLLGTQAGSVVRSLELGDGLGSTAQKREPPATPPPERARPGSRLAPGEGVSRLPSEFRIY